MSETTADTHTHTDTPAPTLSLPEQLRAKLQESTIPLTLKELAKDLTKPKKVKQAEFEASLPGYLEEDFQAGRAFKYASGKAGAERYWHRDEKHAITDAVLMAATEPTKLSDLKKVAREISKADKAYAESLVDELVSGAQLHEHPGKGPPYGREKYESPNHHGRVSEALLTAAAKPAKLGDLIKAAQEATKADKSFVTTLANEMLAAGQLHPHPGKGTPHARHPYESPNNKAKVTAEILAAAAQPAKLGDLIKATISATQADKAFVTTLANELIEAGQLHKHGTGSSATYAKEPPHRYDHGQGKKDFEKLVKAARALLESVKDVSSSDMLELLRVELTKAPPEAKATNTETGLKPTHQPPPLSTDLTSELIRSGLKAAYDDLCLHPEFEDKLVEIRRLYHDVKRKLPDLTVEKFHHELEHLQSQRIAELQPINEVQRAKEPELAIRHADRLLYFVRWR